MNKKIIIIFLLWFLVVLSSQTILAYDLKQSYETSNQQTYIDGINQVMIAHFFDANESYTVFNISVLAGITTGSGNDIGFSIYNSSANNTVGSLICFFGTIPKASWTASAWNTISNSNGCTVVNGSRYWIVFNGSVDAINYIAVRYQDGLSGQGWARYTTAWQTNFTNLRGTFRVYGGLQGINFSVSASNLWNGSSITNFSAYIIGNNYDNPVCFQEWANQSYVCGGLGNGGYNLINVSYTGGYYSFQGAGTQFANGIFNVNYSIPNYANNLSIINLVLPNGSSYNYSSPYCFNSSTLQLKYNMTTVIPFDYQARLFCYGNSTWINLSGIIDYSWFNYTAVYWNISGKNFSSNSSGIIVTDIVNNDSRLFNVTVSSDNYFSQSYNNWNVSSNLNASLFQSQINFSCFEKITNNGLVCLNGTIYPNSGLYNFSINVSGYYSQVTNNSNISALDNKTINVTGFYSSNVSLRSNFLYGGGSNNCSYSLSSSTFPFYSQIVSGSPNASVGLVNGSYVVLSDCQDYILVNYSFVVNSSSLNVTVPTIKSDVIDITLRDEASNVLVSGVNVTLTLNRFSVLNQSIYNSSTGYFHLENLTPDMYNFIFTGYGYRSFDKTLPVRSYLNLTLFLTNSSSVATLHYIDESSGESLQNVFVTMYRVVGGSNVSVESHFTDVTGNAYFFFIPLTFYCFVSSKSGYVDKNYCLSNIVSSSAYNILMKRSSTYPSNISDVVVSLSPNSFFCGDGVNNTFVFSIGSINSQLSDYAYNLSYFNGSHVFSGVNTSGGADVYFFNLSCNSWLDRVSLYYNYSDVVGVHEFYRTWFVGHVGSVVPAENFTFVNNARKDFGMGDGERIIISTLVTFVFAGVGTLLGGSVFGLVLGVAVIGYLGSIGFMPIYPILLVIIVSVVVYLMFVKGSGGNV